MSLAVIASHVAATDIMDLKSCPNYYTVYSFNTYLKTNGRAGRNIRNDTLHTAFSELFMQAQF